ncbi:hypothetical protein YC2023_033735 [Brassica napus]
MKNTLITYIQKKSQTTNLKILEAAYKWKKQKLAASEKDYDYYEVSFELYQNFAVMMMTLGGRRHKTNYSSENGEELEMLKFHMSTSAKYLLIVAILLKKSSRANA